MPRSITKIFLTKIYSSFPFCVKLLKISNLSIISPFKDRSYYQRSKTFFNFEDLNEECPNVSIWWLQLSLLFCNKVSNHFHGDLQVKICQNFAYQISIHAGSKFEGVLGHNGPRFGAILLKFTPEVYFSRERFSV